MSMYLRSVMIYFQNYSDTFSLYNEYQFVPWPSEFKLKNKNNGYYTKKINVSFTKAYEKCNKNKIDRWYKNNQIWRCLVTENICIG